MSETRNTSNPIELEVFKHLFTSVAEEMGVRLMRSAYSPNIKERRDYSCALFDAEGELIAQAAHIPVHLGSAPMSVQATMGVFPPESMQVGEQFLVNDPFAGGTHLPDITVVAPWFAPGETCPTFFVANRAHHADVGGKSPGSMPMSTHIDEEGIRIPPSRLDEELIQRVCEASRTPEERRGDLQAQQAALHAGLQRLDEYVERYGTTHLIAQARELQQYTARGTRRWIQTLPNGVYTFADVLDDDGHGSEDIRICVELTVRDASLSLDFTKSAEQVRGPVNAVRAITVSAVHYVLQCLVSSDLPSNAGFLFPVQIHTRTGSVVDANPPAAVAGGNVETSQRIVDVLLGAFAQVLPSQVPAASCGSMNNLTIGGKDPRSGRSFAYYETLAGGAGASPNRDGAHAVHTHMTNTLNTPVEALEHAYPFQITHYKIRRNSGGEGRFHGGDGILRGYRFLGPVEVTLLTERRKQRPYGLQEGEPGQPGKNMMYNGTETQCLAPKCTLRVSREQTLTIATPGGGGWGPRSTQKKDESTQGKENSIGEA